MPITSFLDGTKFDRETRRVVAVAFEMAWVALGLTENDDLNSIVAQRIIELAKAGERNPDILCEKALKGLRSRRTPRQFQSTTTVRKQALKHLGSRRLRDSRRSRNVKRKITGEPNTESKAEQYERLAHGCLAILLEFSNPFARATLIEMARVWQQLAKEQEEAARLQRLLADNKG